MPVATRGHDEASVVETATIERRNLEAAVTDDVLVETQGSLGRIRLNRPKALNALTLQMIGPIDAALDRFLRDDSVAAVLISGEGDRAFCAGGDLRGFYDAESSDFNESFFRREYRLDTRIARFEKPVVTLMDGIVMGGGVGLSAHARHRVVTERSKIALPETSIGMFPDVGSSWLLPRAPGDIGAFIALVGEPFGAADAIHAGLADVQISSSAIPALVEALAGLPAAAGHDAVRAAIDGFAEAPGPSLLAAGQATIDRCFALDSVAEILAALDADGSDFAAQARATLARRSPSALVAALALQRLGRAARSREACFENEFNAAIALAAEHDFREGIRALLIDRDGAPRWAPDSVEAVPLGRVDDWLRPRVPPLFAAAPREPGSR